MTLLWAATAATALAAGYLAACWLWPFAKCWRCDGAGKRISPSGKAWGTCRWCRSTGARLRVGRKVWLWLRGVEGDAR